MFLLWVLLFSALAALSLGGVALAHARGRGCSTLLLSLAPLLAGYNVLWAWIHEDRLALFFAASIFLLAVSALAALWYRQERLFTLALAASYISWVLDLTIYRPEVLSLPLLFALPPLLGLALYLHLRRRRAFATDIASQ